MLPHLRGFVLTLTPWYTISHPAPYYLHPNPPPLTSSSLLALFPPSWHEPPPADSPHPGLTSPSRLYCLYVCPAPVHQTTQPYLPLGQAAVTGNLQLMGYRGSTWLGWRSRGYGGTCRPKNLDGGLPAGCWYMPCSDTGWICFALPVQQRLHPASVWWKIFNQGFSFLFFYRQLHFFKKTLQTSAFYLIFLWQPFPHA